MSMISSPRCRPQGLSPLAEAWRARLRTVEAMTELVRARHMVHRRPFASWRTGLGSTENVTEKVNASPPDEEALRLAWHLARHVDRAAWRMPGEWLCLPRAIALSRMLRRRQVPHALHIAARPAAARTGADDLHAWIDVGPVRVIGDLPGPWAVIYRAFS